MSLYLVLKFIHITLALIAVGFSASYLIWILRGASDTERMRFVLAEVRFIDSRLTNPAFFGLLLTGVIMVLVIGYRLTTFWIDAAIVLFVTVALLGILVYAPVFRRLRITVETAGVDSPEFRPLLRRSILINILVGAIVLVIVALMVLKPSF